MFDSGPYEKSIGSDIVWRPVTPERWVGGRFRPFSPPVTIDKQLSGSPIKTLVEPFCVSPDSVHAIAEKASTMRVRDTSLELFGEFETCVPRNSYLRSKEEYKNPQPYFPKQYPPPGSRTMFSSLRSVPSTLDALGKTINQPGGEIINNNNNNINEKLDEGNFMGDEGGDDIMLFNEGRALP